MKIIFDDLAEEEFNDELEYYEIELENSKCQKYIVDVPEEVNDFLNTDFIEILEGKGLEIYSGLTPVNVTGNYFVDNWTNFESGTRYVNYSFQFVNQTTDHKIEVRSAAEFSDASAIIAYISGNGPSFPHCCPAPGFSARNICT